MYFFLLTIFLGCVNETDRRSAYLLPADDFIITINTENLGDSSDAEFKIPTESNFFTYLYDVDCNDDGVDEATAQTSDYTCDYSSLGGPGTYTVRIKNQFPRIFFDGRGDKEKILSVEQWGSGKWTSFEYAFRGASNLVINAQDTPDLSLAPSLFGAFQQAEALGSNGNWNWDTSVITNMSSMFFGASDFNGDISGWDTSKNKDLSRMFYNATAFNQDIGNWNIGAVTNLSSLFYNATSFNQDIGAWNTTAVTHMDSVFKFSNFNQDLKNWDTSSVQTMRKMFSRSQFDYDIGGWKTSKVLSLEGTFYNTPFNQDISGWDVSKVENMDDTFGNGQFDQDIGNWDVSSVTTMDSMFYLSSFNQDISGWNVGSVKNMERMFASARQFDRDLSSWDVSAVTNMAGMFVGAYKFSVPSYDALLIGWNKKTLQPNVLFGAQPLRFCTSEAEAAKNIMITSDMWTIEDAGKACIVSAELSADAADLESVGEKLPLIFLRGTITEDALVTVTDTTNGTATAEDYDFSSPQIITIPAGTYDGTSATALVIPTLVIKDDNVYEPDETIEFSVVFRDGATLADTNNDGLRFKVHVYTILNDDSCETSTQCPENQTCNKEQNPAICQALEVCGNNLLEAGEFCDDGNEINGDGCNNLCQIENGSSCQMDSDCQSAICNTKDTEPKCEPADTCGNGTIEEGEFCDDGNTNNDDGCDSECEMESVAECDSDTDCATDKVCEDEVCVQCRQDSDCAKGSCNKNENQCVECLEDEHCASGSCDIQSALCVLGCEDDADCTGEKQTLCRLDENLCSECLATKDCAESEICTSQGACEECVDCNLSDEDSGCGCSSSGSKPFPILMIFLLGILLVNRKRKTSIV